MQDYSVVKGLLAQAEQMGLTGEEVKQAQAMRLRIEVGVGVGEGLCLYRMYSGLDDASLPVHRLVRVHIYIYTWTHQPS